MKQQQAVYLPDLFYGHMSAPTTHVQACMHKHTNLCVAGGSPHHQAVASTATAGTCKGQANRRWSQAAETFVMHGHGTHVYVCGWCTRGRPEGAATTTTTTAGLSTESGKRRKVIGILRLSACVRAAARCKHLLEQQKWLPLPSVQMWLAPAACTRRQALRPPCSPRRSPCAGPGWVNVGWWLISCVQTTAGSNKRS